jgi:cellulose synthase/poly-beta-1,6-N-acetylglucosamine synthase-like glycosyltransferase
VTSGSPLAVAIACAIAYLLLAYALGGPLVLVRALAGAIGERRARYRSQPDDALSSSRFTIPVSVVLPARGVPDLGDAVERLLALQYPEFEVIVVNDGTPEALELLRQRFALSACEVFFRRTLPTGRVGAIFRSGVSERLLVVDCAAGNRADALNCGVNLSRYRYVCCADGLGRYTPGSLLQAMHAAVEDPATVVGISTSLGPFEGGTGEGSTAGDTLVGTLQRLSAVRNLLAQHLRRRLRIGPGGVPGFMLWRRDVLVESGGFALDVPTEQLEMTLRLHRHLLRDGQPYRLVHVTVPLGAPVSADSLAEYVSHGLERQQSMVTVLWRYRGMLFNPRYRTIGMFDLPRVLFGVLVVPWLELACLLALPFAWMAGVLTAAQLVLVYAAVGIGNGVRLNAAMLVAPWPPDDRTTLRLLVLAPLEVFVARPVQLYSRLLGLLRVLVSRPGPAKA